MLYSYILDELYAETSWWEFWKEDTEYIGTKTIAEDYREFGYAALTDYIERNAIIEADDLRTEAMIQEAQEACIWSLEALGNCIKEKIQSGTTVMLSAPPFGYIYRFTTILRNPATSSISNISLPISEESKLTGMSLNLSMTSPVTLMQNNYMSATTTISGTSRSYYDHMMFYWDLMWRLAFALWILYTITGVGARLGSNVQGMHSQEIQRSNNIAQAKRQAWLNASRRK